MAGGVVVNSGLHFCQPLISLHIRRALTAHAHKKYLHGLSFYRAAVLNQGDLDNIDQRISRDIQNFSDNVAFLYGHSFKPMLEFGLSLYEASHDLGYRRPLALFGATVFVNLLFRSLSPNVGAMVAREAELEGNLQRAHTRVITHAEEIAFLRGAETERAILDERLDELTDAKSWHTVQRIRKSVADNVVKFSGMLVGGVFVHVPFLLATDLTESQRISRFRATEELMMRCGTSFTELLLLGKELQELGGYTSRIT